MKYVLVLVCLCFSDALQTQDPVQPAVDLPGSLLGSLTRVTTQFQGVQQVLGELNSQLNRMIASGTRLVSGLAAEGGPAVPGTGNNGLDSIGGSIIGSLSSVTSQMTSVQKTLGELGAQLQRMITTGTKLISGGRALLAEGNQPNYGESVISSVQEWTKNLEGMSQVLREMNNQWQRMLETGSKIVSGKLLAEETGPAPTDTLLKALSGFTEQFTGMQRVLGELSAQLNRMISTGSKMIGGGALLAEGAAPSPTDSILEALNGFTQQFQGMQRVLTELSSQLNRMVETGSRMITGKLMAEEGTRAEGGPGTSPTDSVLQALGGLTQQFQAMQRVLGELSAQFNRILSTGSKVLTGGLMAEEAGPSPTDSVLKALTGFTEQFQGMQRVLTDLNAQLNRMISTGSRMISGVEAEEPIRRKRVDNQVITGLQRATEDLTRQLGSAGSTLTKILAGATGIRIGGNGGTRGLEDTFQSLNPVAAIGRQVGNIAGSLTRVLPTNG